MRTFITIIFVLVCIALTVVVLAQQGKDAGLGAIGGIGDTYWSKNKSRSMEGKAGSVYDGFGRIIYRACRYSEFEFLNHRLALLSWQAEHF